MELKLRYRNAYLILHRVKEKDNIKQDESVIFYITWQVVLTFFNRNTCLCGKKCCEEEHISPYVNITGSVIQKI